MRCSAAALLAFGLGACGRSSGRRLNIYNYSNYIASSTMPDYRAANPDIDIIYDEFSSQDVLFAKLKLGAAYDIVVASDYMLRRLIRQNILAPIQGFEHYGDLMDMFNKSPWDKLRRFCVPFLWGTTGIGYNSRKVKTPPTSWSDMWQANYQSRLTMLDEKRDAIGAALILAGCNPNSIDPQELQKAAQLLEKQKPLLRQYTCDYIDGLARNEIWLAQAWSGDVAKARLSNPAIEYCLPQEGSFYFVDSWCIPNTAANKKEAIAFLNYVMQPQVIAKITNATGYPNTMKSSQRYVSPELMDNPLGYPPPDMLKRTFPQTDIGAQERVWDEIWENIKFKK